MGKETCVYLDDIDTKLLSKYQKMFGNKSAVVREALRFFDKYKTNELLREKYRSEKGLSQEIESIQSEAAMDLGDYEW